MKKADFYRKSQNKEVICSLCPNKCKILPKESGICGVRYNIDGVLTAESYGKITLMALEPIEKTPLYRFYPGTQIFSLGGYRCNFNCGFCQNYEISMQEAPYREFLPKEIAEMSKAHIAQGNIGVAYTYNEPLINYEFVRDCALIIKGQDQKNVLITNGFINRKPWEQLLPLIDAVNIDLKSFNPLFYREIGGNLKNVKENIKIAAANCHVEITTLIIPGKNDSVREMNFLSEWLASVDPDIPLHLTRFFPMYKMSEANPTTVWTVNTLVETAKQNLKYVYV